MSPTPLRVVPLLALLATLLSACGGSSAGQVPLFSDQTQHQVDLMTALTALEANPYAEEVPAELIVARELIQRAALAQNPDAADHSAHALLVAAAEGQIEMLRAYFARRQAEARLRARQGELGPDGATYWGYDQGGE